MHAGADVECAELVVVARGEHAVSEENIDQLVLRVGPGKRAREARMAETDGAGIGGGTEAGLFGVGLVEGDAAPTESRIIVARPLPQRRLADVARAAIFAHLQVHLHQFGQVIGSAEKPRVARQSAEHCPAFIVNRAEQLRLAEKRIVFGGHDPVFRVKPQRIVGQRIGSERLVECLFQVRFKITACLPRHKLRVQVKR